MSDQTHIATHEASLPANREDEVVFDTVLYPHRSLSPKGFMVLMGCVAGFSFAAGIAFMAAGAWPVVGFFGIDVLLFYLFFRWSYRAARLHEHLHMTRDRLTVRRVQPSGRYREWSFQPTWLRVEVDGNAEQNTEITLASHGRSLAIARFLTPPERADLATALRDAARTASTPKFV